MQPRVDAKSLIALEEVCVRVYDKVASDDTAAFGNIHKAYRFHLLSHLMDDVRRFDPLGNILL